MIERILAAVDDSPAGLAAARTAVALARTCGASLRMVTVVADSEVTAAISASGAPRSTERRQASGRALLEHALALARHAGLDAQIVQRSGEPGHEILQQARAWPADLVVIGRSEHPGAGGPYIGPQTRIVLEFADQPVLVVPVPGTSGSPGGTKAPSRERGPG